MPYMSNYAIKFHLDYTKCFEERLEHILFSLKVIFTLEILNHLFKHENAQILFASVCLG